ncbi:MAG: tetratricopeptide repeat protein [Ruminiclostridium sp.]|nr:tetratricopeptide repeat protein [Ruminiclostridium sp.]
MNIPLIFTAVVICLLALYIMNRFVKKPSPVSILILVLQFMAATVTVFSLFEDVLTTPAVELGIIVAGIILPLSVVVFDHIAFSRRLQKTGIREPFLEKKAGKKSGIWNVTSFTTNAELWKNEIHAMDVYRSITLGDEQVLENVKKQLILAQRLINLDRYEIAAEKYKMLSAILPVSSGVAYNAGYLHCFIGKYREAYKFLNNGLKFVQKEQRTAKESKEDNKQKKYTPQEMETMLHFYLGYALYHLGKYEHALRHYQKVLETKPDLTVVFKNIARAYLALEMSEKAIEYLEKGRGDLRDNSMRIVLGSIYYQKGETKKALDVLDEVAKADDKQLEALKWKGKSALKEKMFDKAEECFSELVDLEPTEPSHFYHLALAQRSLGEKTKALKTYEAGISAHPQSSILLYNAGTLMDEMGQKEKAADVLYKSLQGDDYQEDAVNYLGVLLGQMKQYRESVQVFDKGLVQFDKSYQLWFNRGIVLDMARRQEDAVASFDRAYELNQEDPVLVNYFTAALLQTRDYSKAIRILKQGLNNHPDDAELMYGLSKVYSHMGEKDVAVDLLKRVIELDPVYLVRIKKDLDFKTLQNHPGYKSLMVS